ncbi:cystathionine beta-lyase [Polymorphobacter arshaanensis]|uniref:Cystathionine beta-lyase n=1 Tax=Glacieibacterium arshaanense TaxID=2511025 RepID=A0A4Y9EQF5_9SPHN|nr:cystathionine beta-lyase [Polymorphobacter arshaanensis]TFU05814.1 cystathionine beta-lyase [Polymorphobacter arshaanensis]
MAVDNGKDKAPATRLAEAGRRADWTRPPGARAGIVNPPVWHASTILFDNLAALDAGIAAPDAGLYYGRRGTPTSWALETALTELEPGAAGTCLYPSGVAAIAAALLSLLKAGDHLLVTDSAYEPTRSFADRTLRDLGIETTYYDPLIGAGIAALVRPNTRAILLESPGSLSFDVQDVPAIVAVARARDIVTVLDNTWATPLLFPAIGHGIDMSVQALTKYVAGHSDVMMGAVTTTAAHYPKLRSASYRLGYCVGPDDAYLTLRGLRTLGVRLAQQGKSALKIAHWLAAHPAVERVLHPALPGCPGHDLWARDFTGASGLFGFVLKQGKRSQTAALIDDLDHFGIGFSWGGFESLILPSNVAPIRTATQFEAPGPLLRLSIGLEDPDDLIADLAAGLERYQAQF